MFRKNMKDTNNLFRAPCVPLEIRQILSEAFLDAMDQWYSTVFVRVPPKSLVYNSSYT
jgi:hypothetical protein